VHTHTHTHRLSENVRCTATSEIAVVDFYSSWCKCEWRWCKNWPCDARCVWLPGNQRGFYGGSLKLGVLGCCWLNSKGTNTNI